MIAPCHVWKEQRNSKIRVFLWKNWLILSVVLNGDPNEKEKSTQEKSDHAEQWKSTERPDLTVLSEVEELSVIPSTL